MPSIDRAKAAAMKILGCYPSLNVSDKEVFVAGLVALLTTYPAEVVARAADPSRGIAATLKFLNIAEIRDALDGWTVEHTEQMKRKLAPPSQLGDFAATMREHVSEANFWSWFSQMRLVCRPGEQITLAVRSEWVADEIRSRFQNQILDAAGVNRLVLEVDPSLKDVNRGPAPEKSVKLR
jgi:hypothetical protein